MATTAIPKSKIAGGSFLLEERQTSEVFTPEDFSEQHTLIGQTTEEFAVNEILPNVERIEHKEFQVTRDLLKKAGELGLSGVEIPEAYGGLEMDKVTAAVIADHIAKYAGFATTWGGHSGIGTLPIVYFGTEEQKKKYLPRLATGEMVGAYALSESTSGSDAMCVDGGRVSLENAIGYAKQREAFGKVIGDFGVIREKIANMAALIYVGESQVYRTVGMMDAALSEVDKASADALKETRKAIEEYAVECSIIKVWGSEMIDYVVDETMQIYAGYGFVEEYPAERAYRDARINRIFEGTNEINRLIITGFLLKRAMSGQLPLMPAIKKLMDEVLAGPTLSEELEGPLADERKLVAQAKRLGLFVAGAATQKYMQAIQDQQEVMGAIAGMVIETYAMESAVLRAQKIAERNGEKAASLPIAMTRVYLSRAMEKIEAAAKKVIAAVAEGDMLRTQLAILRRLAKHEPFNVIELRQQISRKIIERGKYTLR